MLRVGAACGIRGARALLAWPQRARVMPQAKFFSDESSTAEKTIAFEKEAKTSGGEQSLLCRLTFDQVKRDGTTKRWFKEAGVAKHTDSWLLTLDGRVVKSPKQKPIALPTEASAWIVAGEWEKQAENVLPHTMPLVRQASFERFESLIRVVLLTDGR
jgi:hypothetical protein